METWLWSVQAAGAGGSLALFFGCGVPLGGVYAFLVSTQVGAVLGAGARLAAFGGDGAVGGFGVLFLAAVNLLAP